MQAENRAGADERNPWTASLRGWARKCPSCGQGQLFDGFLKVHDRCPSCGEELFHHRADDGPAWATLVITGHLLAPLMITIFTVFRPEAWVMALGFGLGFVLLSLYLLPRMKGVFVGIQWANRMHGFGRVPDSRPGT